MKINYKPKELIRRLEKFESVVAVIPWLLALLGGIAGAGIGIDSEYLILSVAIGAAIYWAIGYVLAYVAQLWIESVRCVAQAEESIHTQGKLLKQLAERLDPDSATPEHQFSVPKDQYVPTPTPPTPPPSQQLYSPPHGRR